jgi:hypothetical protein
MTDVGLSWWNDVSAERAHQCSLMAKQFLDDPQEGRVKAFGEALALYILLDGDVALLRGSRPAAANDHVPLIMNGLRRCEAALDLINPAVLPSRKESVEYLRKWNTELKQQLLKQDSKRIVLKTRQGLKSSQERASPRLLPSGLRFALLHAFRLSKINENSATAGTRVTSPASASRRGRSR